MLTVLPSLPKIFTSEDGVEVKRNVLMLWANLAEKYPGE
jgi:hypothetical protein